MTVLVTGAAGFLGTALIQQLSTAGIPTVAVARSPRPAKFAGLRGVTWVEKDLLSPEFSSSDLDGIETVFHLAAIKEQKPGQDESAFVRENEEVTVKILEASAGKVKKIIFASSQMVYGDPDHTSVTEDFPLQGAESSPYACSKLNSENWLRCLQKKNGAQVIILRFCGFVDGGGNIDYMINQAQKNSPIELFSQGKIARDYLTSEDAAKVFLLAHNYRPEQAIEVFNIGSGTIISTAEIAHAIRDQLSSKSEIRLVDTPAPRKNFVYDLTRATELLKFKPADLMASIRSYANKKNEHEHA